MIFALYQEGKNLMIMQLNDSLTENHSQSGQALTESIMIFALCVFIGVVFIKSELWRQFIDRSFGLKGDSQYSKIVSFDLANERFVEIKINSR